MSFKLLERVKNTKYKQLLGCLAAAISVAVTGTFLSWGSPVSQKLTGEEKELDFQLTTEETSWVLSGYSLGLLISYFFVYYPIERFGRKKALLFAAPLLFLNWLGIILFKNFILLLISRIIGGIGSGFVLAGASIYSSEIADKDVRGRLSSVIGVLKLSGNLYVLTVGPFVSYYTLAWTCSLIPIIFFVAFFRMPESSYFYLKKGQTIEAEKSLKYFTPVNVTEEQFQEKFKKIQTAVEKEMLNKSSFKELFSNELHRKTFLIFLGLKTLQQLSGITAIESYMESIIAESGSSISDDTSSIIFGFVQIFGALLATSLIDFLGRKPLLIISALGCSISLAAEGIYFFMKDVLEADVSSLSWLPTTGIVIYLLLCCAGIYSLPTIMLGEFFATNIKEYAVSLLMFFGAALSFLVTKLFSPLSEKWGMHVVFWLFAGICFWGAIFVYFFVPETKNKSLGDIQEILSANLKKGHNMNNRSSETIKDKI